MGLVALEAILAHANVAREALRDLVADLFVAGETKRGTPFAQETRVRRLMRLVAPIAQGEKTGVLVLLFAGLAQGFFVAGEAKLGLGFAQEFGSFVRQMRAMTGEASPLVCGRMGGKGECAYALRTSFLGGGFAVDASMAGAAEATRRLSEQVRKAALVRRVAGQTTPGLGHLASCVKAFVSVVATLTKPLSSLDSEGVEPRFGLLVAESAVTKARRTVARAACFADLLVAGACGASLADALGGTVSCTA